MTLQVSGESAQSSEAEFSSHNPVFEQEFVFKVTSALSDNLTLKVNTDVQIVGVTNNKSFINNVRNTSNFKKMPLLEKQGGKPT